MRYYTTEAFFSKVSECRSLDHLKISDAKWLRYLNAFASRHRMISEKQKVVLEDIFLKYDLTIDDTLTIDGESDEMV